jgi:hypothetical protein
MVRLTCPRCGLSLTVRSMLIAPPYCPRCLGRRRALVELATSAPRARAGVGRADQGGRESRQRTPRRP